MAQFLPYTWPIVDKEAVCAQQTHIGAATLTLDGTLSDFASIPDQVSFIANNMIRTFSITGTGMSGVNFVVKGLQNGALVTETIAGPSSGTVWGTKYYDIIQSITTDGGVTDVKVGTGTAGYLPLISANVDVGNINYSFSVLLNSGSSVNYTMFQTLDSINTNFIPFETQTLFPVSGAVNLTVSTLLTFTAITNFLLLKINSSAETDSFDFIFLQE